MARVSVLYKVPVEVFVDTEEGVVERVILLGGEMYADEGADAFLRDPEDPTKSKPIAHDEELAVAAREIAEDAVWPVWDREG